MRFTMPFFDRFLEIIEDEKGISSLSFTDVNDAPLMEANATMLELMEYMEGKRKAFTRPLVLEGTRCQKAGWAARVAIP